ncbi:hypothetical protein KCP69_00685 [Salmonella enterica subsp. enterica]|nr:hypothetical protein KCP69_00685 [Salmonella enterica subsp. enterica]
MKLVELWRFKQSSNTGACRRRQCDASTPARYWRKSKSLTCKSPDYPDAKSWLKRRLTRAVKRAKLRWRVIPSTPAPGVRLPSASSRVRPLKIWINDLRWMRKMLLA